MPKPTRQLEPDEIMPRQKCDCGARMKVTHTAARYRRYRCGADPTWKKQWKKRQKRKPGSPACDAPNEVRRRFVWRLFVKDEG